MGTASKNEVEPTATEGVVPLMYRAVALGLHSLRHANTQTLVLLAVVAGYLVIGFQLLNDVDWNTQSARALLASLSVAELLVEVPALSLGTWALTIAGGVALTAYIQFFGYVWHTRSGRPRRTAFLMILTTLVALVGVLILLAAPAMVTLTLAVMLLIILVAPRDSLDGDGVRVGLRKSQVIHKNSIGTLYYVTIFGIRTQSKPDSESADPGNTSPDEGDTYQEVSEFINNYFSSGSYRLRRLLGLAAISLMAVSLVLALLGAQPWVAAEKFTLEMTEGEIAEAPGDLRRAMIEADECLGLDEQRCASSPPEPDQFDSAGPRVLRPSVAGRPYGESSDSVVVLTNGSEPRVIFLSESWIDTREICRVENSIWSKPILDQTGLLKIFGFNERYEQCPD